MRKELSISIITLLFTVFLFSCNSSNENTAADVKKGENMETKSSGTYQIDLDKSVVSYKGVMLGIKEHTGDLKFKSGQLEVKDGVVTGGNFVVDMSTITPTDNNYNAENPKENLIGHLSSPDFFDVPNNPTASFTISGNDDKGNITGSMKIRGTDGKEKVKNITMTKEGETTKISGDLTFDRKNYGVSFDMPVKEMVIADNVDLKIKLAVKM